MLRKLHSVYTSQCRRTTNFMSDLHNACIPGLMYSSHSIKFCILLCIMYIFLCILYLFISASPPDEARLDEVTARKTEMSDCEEATTETPIDAAAGADDDGFVVARKRKSKKIAPVKDDTTDNVTTDPAMVRLKDDSVAIPTSSKGSSVGFVGEQPEEGRESRDRRFSADRFQDSEVGSGKARTKGLSPSSLLPSTMRFFSGNPMVETTEGIIHLYKDRSVQSTKIIYPTQ